MAEKELAPELKLLICETLPNDDLARMSRVSTKWNAPALKTLYEREAQAGNYEAKALSKTMRKACRYNSTAVQDAATGTFEMLIAAYHRKNLLLNINALTGSPTDCWTALAQVTWTPHEPDRQVIWIRKLIEAGASINVQCTRNFLILGDWEWNLPSDQGPDLGNQRRLRLIRKRVLDVVRNFTCLFFPMTSGNEKVLKLLLTEPCVDPRLAYPLADGFGAEDATFTILHGLAMHATDLTGLSRRMLDRYQSLMDLPLPVPDVGGPGAKAIHLAILSRNNCMLKLLIRYGADLNAEMGVDHIAPLHLLIEQMRETESNRDRKDLSENFRRLLQAGANPDYALPVGNQYTPLLALIESMRSLSSWTEQMKGVAQTLLYHEADPNIPDILGNTPLDLLAFIIMSDVSKPSVVRGAEWFIDFLIDRHGADPNFFNATNHNSLMGLVLKQHVTRNRPFKTLLARLCNRGARFGRDLNHCFDLWLDDGKLVELYDMRQHQGQLDQQRVNAAFVRAVKKNEWKRFQKTRERMPDPTNASELLWEAFEPRNYQWATVEELLGWGWDPNYVDPIRGTGIMAQMVRCACDPSSGYSVKPATDHFKVLVQGGASVLSQDPMGMTPIRYLWENEGPRCLGPLKSLVSEQSARECGFI